MKFLSIAAILIVIFSGNILAQRKPVKSKTGKICGNPQLKCKNAEYENQPYELFQPYELQFEADQPISESEMFYSIILKTVKLNKNTTCDTAVTEDERLQIQSLFPDHKVFELKCSEAGTVYYTNIADNVDFIAVYAGKTLAEAQKFLKLVQTGGQFKGANIRKMKAAFNGT